MTHKNRAHECNFKDSWYNVEDQCGQHEVDSSGAAIHRFRQGSRLTLQMETEIEIVQMQKQAFTH